MSASVLMVCSQYPPVYGGAGSQAALLARTLARRGWKVSVVTLDQRAVGDSLDRGVQVLRCGQGLQPQALLSRIVSSLLLGFVAAYRVARDRPSVVHVHGCYWWTIPPALAAKMIGARLVIKVTRDGEDDPGTVLGRRLGRIPIGWLYGLPFRIASSIIVLNAEAHGSAVRSGLGHKLHRVPNGVDTDAFRRTPERRAHAVEGLETARVVCFVGYAARHKGFYDLLEAWRLADLDETELWIVGPTTGFYRELEESAPDAIAQMRADGYRVRELGTVPQDDLPRILWAVDVFVLPSYSEGMPNSLFEAVVAGCQIVATNIPGIQDFFSPDQIRMSDPGNVAALASNIRDALESDSSDLSTRLRDLQERLSIDHVASHMEEIYDVGSQAG